jgi:type VI secretion system secreted protein Hcp
VALNAYLRLEGERQGEIEGSVTQKGRERSILVIAFTHEVTSPRDTVTGLATGRRQHGPLVITKEIDRATSPLHAAQAGNESFKRWELDLYTSQLHVGAGSGAEVLYFTIKLTNASIASFRTEMPNNKHADLAKLNTFEEIAFTYQTIEWTWTDGGLSAVDDWENRVD